MGRPTWTFVYSNGFKTYNKDNILFSEAIEEMLLKAAGFEFANFNLVKYSTISAFTIALGCFICQKFTGDTREQP